MFNSSAAANAVMPALYHDQKKQRQYYEQQLKKLLKKIEIAEDLDTVKKYVKEQGLD
jgi:hypothetical protein